MYIEGEFATMMDNLEGNPLPVFGQVWIRLPALACVFETGKPEDHRLPQSAGRRAMNPIPGIMANIEKICAGRTNEMLIRPGIIGSASHDRLNGRAQGGAERMIGAGVVISIVREQRVMIV